MVARQKAMLCCKEGSHSPLQQMQNGMMQLESVGADSDVQCDLDAVDAVRCDTRSQHVERGGPGPRAAARQKATLCGRGKSDSLTDTNAVEAARKCRSRLLKPA